MAVTRPRFRLATLFTFLFGFAVGLVWNDLVGSFLARRFAAKTSSQSVFYTAGELPVVEYPFSEPLTLAEAITRVGGLGDLASNSRVTVIRGNDDRSRSRIQVDVTNPSGASTPIHDGDTVFVEEVTP